MSAALTWNLALDVEKLSRGRYAEMLKALLDTGRYKQGDKSFQLMTEVDLGDAKPVERVDVEFLAPQEIKLKKNKPKLFPEFRVLQADGCGAAFRAPEQVTVTGKTVLGAKNKVSFQVASLPDFLIMKAFALGGRDKPKDAYDICYCLDHGSGGMASLARNWKKRKQDKIVARAKTILQEKFESVVSFGPMQVVEFYNSANPEERSSQARRAYEVVRAFLKML
ncbi:MAG: nucleotidyl transferase AbiEii/AbiGii toxin family protein [Verrucomicrobia bacterium]|nr:nucleotidyl transferase AbiEii/AbiGii toxin family protein [Verrucomicrobiota bacterium]